jgi:microcystin-dependent protein
MRLIKQVLLADIGSSMTSGKLTAPDGTPTAPSIGFASDATAGFYLKAPGQVGITGSLRGTGSVNVGFIGMYAGATAPTGYLICDGQAVSRTTYADLFSAIGTTWGAGDGSTTFNVPGLNDRYPRHRNVSGAAGAVGTVQSDQNKAHTHAVSGTSGANSVDHTHLFSGTTGSMNQNATHTHTSNAAAAGSTWTANPGSSFTVYQTGAATINAANTDHQHNFSGTTGGASTTHAHAISLTSAGGSADGAEARPLSASLLFCIRAL